ncbi:hypothetical protein NGA35_07735 [Pseudomonas stutzeri]|nr:hypothetical protein [Stutzerimonas stutzeri]
MKEKASSPLKDVIEKESFLSPLVRPGMGAVEAGHHDYFDKDVRRAFGDSLDLDKAMQRGNEKESRWDYLLGHSPTGQVVAVEPHPVKQDEVSSVIKKKKSAIAQMRGHFVDGAKVSKWLWVASGKVCFASTEKAMRMLDQNGIEFVGSQVKAKNLPRK